jgi:hypothetical protein
VFTLALSSIENDSGSAYDQAHESGEFISRYDVGNVVLRPSHYLTRTVGSSPAGAGSRVTNVDRTIYADLHCVRTGRSSNNVVTSFTPHLAGDMTGDASFAVRFVPQPFFSQLLHQPLELTVFFTKIWQSPCLASIAE